MSRYYEAKMQEGFNKIVSDVKSNKIAGIQSCMNEKAIKDTEDFYGKGSAQRFHCLTDGENYVWLEKVSPENVGLKKWGMNDARGIISLLEKRYNTRFIDEEDLGIMHIR